MSNLRDIDQVPANLEPKLRGLLRSLREHVRSLTGLDGQGNRVILSESAVQEIVNEAVANLPGGGGGGGTPPVYVPDLTAPPTPAGVTVTAGLTNIFIETDNPTFSEGHGYARTIVYGQQWEEGQPDPTFSGAVKVHEFVGSVGSFTVRPGAKWSLWLKWLTEDGVESTAPSGGTNGHVAEAGKIGNADLGALIVEAGNLAEGAVTAAKFGAGIEPVTIVTAASLPTVKSTNAIYWSGKLYRWNGAAYVATVPTTDLSGQVADAQIAGLAASKVTGQLSDSQIAAVAAAKLTGQIVGTQITDGAISTAKLSAGSVTTAALAADAVTADKIAANAVTASEIAAGAVTTAKLAAGAVTANEIAAGAITTAKLAAGAVTAAEIAADAVTAGKIQAGAITTSKLLVSGKGAALNADPWCMDASAWVRGGGGELQMLTAQTDLPSGTTAIANAPGVRAQPISLDFLPVDQGVAYLVEAYARLIGGAGGTCYLGVGWYNAAKQLLVSNQPQPSGAGSPAGWGNGAYSYFGLAGQTPPATWTRYTAAFGPGQSRAIPSNARFMRIVALLNLSDTAGAQHAVTGLKISQMAAADLIVDGSIVASKLAANAIAVGTAAVENGAINNAMIGNAAIDDAKIANLSAAKLTAGDGTIGGNLKSSTYSAVLQQGWIIRPDGFAEFNDIVVRGTVFASQGAIGGSLIGSSYVMSTNWLNMTEGWRLNSDGSFQLNGVGWINTAAIGDAQITEAKIADAAITSAKIADAQITTAKIQDAAVGTLQIAEESVFLSVYSFVPRQDVYDGTCRTADYEVQIASATIGGLPGPGTGIVLFNTRSAVTDARTVTFCDSSGSFNISSVDSDEIIAQAYSQSGPARFLNLDVRVNGVTRYTVAGPYNGQTLGNFAMFTRFACSVPLVAGTNNVTVHLRMSQSTYAQRMTIRYFVPPSDMIVLSGKR